MSRLILFSRSRRQLALMFAFVAMALLPACSGPGTTGSGNDVPAIAMKPEPEPEYVEARPVTAAPEPAPEAYSDRSGTPFRSGKIRVKGRALEVTDSSGRIVATHGSIIRLSDENGRCPAEGFNRIVVKGDYFTIEQQTCSGMLFIDEYITFKAAGDGRIMLHKFGIVKTDRSDPERNIPERVLSTKDFGSLELGKVRIDELYGMFE